MRADRGDIVCLYGTGARSVVIDTKSEDGVRLYLLRPPAHAFINELCRSQWFTEEDFEVLERANGSRVADITDPKDWVAGTEGER